ncbi:UDP-glucose,sterol transferase [Metarhizium brunneum]
MAFNPNFAMDAPEGSAAMPSRHHNDDDDLDPLQTTGSLSKPREAVQSQEHSPVIRDSEPSPAGGASFQRRFPALEMWQTTDFADKRERAQSIPSRAWIPLMDSLVEKEKGDASDSSDFLDDSSPTESEGEADTRRKSVRHKPCVPDKKRLSRLIKLNKHCTGTCRAQRDGRLSISVHETQGTGYMANAMGAVTHSMRPKRKRATVPMKVIPALPQLPEKINVVIMVVGSRGDVQPFLRIGKYLKEEFHHRVRIATHPVFRDIIQEAGLEFFSVGGDPSELMEFMVKNPGMIPTFQSLRAGEIGRRRAAMAVMFDGFWRACIHATEDEETSLRADAMEGRDDIFIADAIIANPPSFAHIHCAEALGVPLHLVFTFPYTPTQAFPHPLAIIKGGNKSGGDKGYTNFMSYPLVETMTWQGLGDLINDFRVQKLSLDAVSTFWAPYAIYRMHVPFTYLWSPALIPKPEDWGEEISISGFVFLDLASTFKPSQALVDFLNAGEPPIYIGFGSIVVENAEAFTRMIFDAVKKAGVRALVSRGWGGLGQDNVPDDIFMLDNIPHDWLFPKIKACVHHGGAGTTAIGLKCGLPTMIVPFFGDQYFWGSMVGKSGAGPQPIPYKHLNADKLADGIRYLLTTEAQAAAGKIGESIRHDGDGAMNTMESFQNQLRMYGPSSLSCSIIKSDVAVWKVRGTHIKLCVLAAAILVDSGQLCWKKLRLLRHSEWSDFEGPGEPVTAVAESVKNSLRDVLSGIASAPYRVGKTAKRRIRHKLRQRADRKNKDNRRPSSSNTLIEKASVAAKKQEKTRKLSLTRVPSVRQYGRDISTSMRKTGLAVVRAPTLFIVALAQGLHNAPRLYGDDTVRRSTRVTGIRSGLVASRREFIWGIYDGVTGVIRLPIQGAKNEGVVGFVKGAGMGIGGLVLKPISAIVGPFGYTMQGLTKQIQRRRSPANFVRLARIAEGQRELAALQAPEAETVRQQVLAGWQVLDKLSQAVASAQGYFVGKVDKTEFMFMNVERAKACLDDLSSGKSFRQVMDTYKSWNVKPHDPAAKSGAFRSTRS